MIAVEANAKLKSTGGPRHSSNCCYVLARRLLEPKMIIKTKAAAVDKIDAGFHDYHICHLLHFSSGFMPFLQCVGGSHHRSLAPANPNTESLLFLIMRVSH